MDVILRKDVEKLGKEGAIVHVKDGYARNFLVPHGLATEATPSVVRAIEEERRQQRRKVERLQQEREALKQKLEKAVVTLSLTIGEQDTAFGSVTAHDIAEALGAQGFDVEKSMLQLEAPIKSLGTFQVTVRLHANVIATLNVQVVKA